MNGMKVQLEKLLNLVSSGAMAPDTALGKMVAAFDGAVADLVQDGKKLTALENAGVDNWEGYSHAMDLFHDEEDEDAHGTD